MPYYRKCSQCGAVEPVAWRGSRFNVDWEIGDWDEFAKAYPDIARRILGLGERYRVISGDFVYWRQPGSSSNLIHRIPLVIYRANGNHCRGRGGYQESRRARVLAGNRKLTEAGIEYIHPSGRQQPATVSTGQLGEPPTPTGIDGNNKVTNYQEVTNRSPHAREGLAHFPLEAKGGRR